MAERSGKRGTGLPRGIVPEDVTADDFRRDVTRDPGFQPAASGVSAPDGTSGGNTGAVQGTTPDWKGMPPTSSAEEGATTRHHTPGVNAGRPLGTDPYQED